MAEDGDKKDDEKVELDSTGQILGYISLDQARVLALQHARENTDFYGEVYGQQELTWEELNSEESEDYYRVRLSYRPIRGFNGRSGVELFTIDKAGPIEFRQILQEPRTRPKFLLPVIAAGVAVLVAAVVGGFWSMGFQGQGYPLRLLGLRTLSRPPPQSLFPSRTKVRSLLSHRMEA